MSVPRGVPAVRLLAVALVVGLLGACGGEYDSGGAATGTESVSRSLAPASPSIATSSPAKPSAAKTATPRAGEARIVYSRGKVTSSVGKRLQVRVGQTVRLVVSSDKAEEVHVHGYDRRTDVGPGETVRVQFRADIPGIFEIEMEKSHDLLLRLQVR